MESPIEIHNNTSIELTRIVRFKDEYFMNKRYFYIADIWCIEASRYSSDKLKCTKITSNDGSTFIVSESYKAIRDTHKVWQKLIQEIERAKDAPPPEITE